MINSFKGEYAWLSNFWPCDVWSWPTAEHAYQSMKSTDVDYKRALRFVSPGKAKKLGQQVKLRENWDQIKLKVMESIIWYKFNENLDLKTKLLVTGNEELIEGNYWGDTYWGVCNGKGENHLGKILMEIRKKIQ